MSAETDVLHHRNARRNTARAALEQRAPGLPLSIEADIQLLLARWNDTKVDYPTGSCIHQLFEAQAAQTPDNTAVEFNNEQLSYRELNARANKVAHYLRSLGVEPRSLVGIYVERSLKMIVGLLGILKAGAAYVPLDPSYPKDRLGFMLADARMKAVLSEQSLIAELPQLGPEGMRIVSLDSEWQTIACASDENPFCEAEADDLAYVIYTSGSTGRPKGVQVLHRAVVNFLTSMRREPGLAPEDILLSVTTISFDIAALEMFLPLITGTRLVIASREVASDGARLLEEVARCGATTLQATPATWRLLLAAGWQGDGRLHMLCGGEALPRDLASEMLKRGGPLWNLYGPTETTIWSTAFQVKLDDKTILIGRPIANTQIYLLDERLESVPVGEAGELHIGGDGLARGYLNLAALTAEKFIPDPFSARPGARLYKTGDLARYLPGGDIDCLGRIDHQVKIRGFRIELGEIEAALRTHPEVSEAVVIAAEVEPGDKRLVAYVVSSRASRAVMPGELRGFLSNKLPDYMIPSAIVRLDALPLTPNGKVDRKALPAPDLAQAERCEPHVAPRDPLEHQLTEIWEQVLGVRPIGVRDNFFELGGHSLLAARMMGEVEKVCGKRLALDTLNKEATIEYIAGLLIEQESRAVSLPIVEFQAGGARLPFFFLHGDFSGGGFYCAKLAQHLGKDQPFYALPPHGVDGQPIPFTIEEMAECRLKTLRDFQPRGPYLLGGFCNGALVAFEMARRLEAQGEKVGLLVLIYASASNIRFKPLKHMADGFGRLLGQERERRINNFLLLRSRAQRLNEIRSYYAARIKELSQSGIDEQMAIAIKKSRSVFGKLQRAFTGGNAGAAQAKTTSQKLAPEDSGQETGEGYRRIIRWDITDSYHKIMDSYIPRPYKGRVTLLWPDEAASEVPGDPTMGWHRVAREGVEVLGIPGKHLTCITRHAEALAERLKACLDKTHG